MGGRTSDPDRTDKRHRPHSPGIGERLSGIGHIVADELREERVSGRGELHVALASAPVEA